MPLLIMSLQTCYGSILSPLRKLQRLSLGVSLYGAYGSREEGDSEPEMEEVERSMNIVASKQIAKTLPSLRLITCVPASRMRARVYLSVNARLIVSGIVSDRWQNITPDKKFPSGYFQPGGECEDSDEHRSFELEPLEYAIRRDPTGVVVAVEPLGTH